MKQVTIYTDGSCIRNPYGPGGWSAILIYKDQIKEFSGGEQRTTNNRMELTAAIYGLGKLKEPCEVTLYSDSRYVVDGIMKNWAISWKRKNWKKSDGKPALNIDLWDILLQLCSKHKVEFKWVKGHNGNKYNERCDELAIQARNKYR